MEPGQHGEPLTAAGKAEAHRAQAEALRYVLADLDAPGSVTAASVSPAAVAALAALAIGTLRAVAQIRGISGRVEQDADIRALLRTELESAEMSVMFDAVAAEERSG